MAGAKGVTSVPRTLLDQGTYVEGRDNRLRTPFHYAITVQHLDWPEQGRVGKALSKECRLGDRRFAKETSSCAWEKKAQTLLWWLREKDPLFKGYWPTSHCKYSPPNHALLIFRSLLQSSQHSDLVICSTGRKYAVHKAIVCTKSPFFKAICASSFKVCDALCPRKILIQD